MPGDIWGRGAADPWKLYLCILQQHSDKHVDFTALDLTSQLAPFAYLICLLVSHLTSA